MTFDNAVAFCTGLDNCNGQNYELPTVQQLVSVLDYTERNPAVTPGVFSNVASSTYWSATELAGSTSIAWALAFGGISKGVAISRGWCVSDGKDAYVP